MKQDTTRVNICTSLAINSSEIFTINRKEQVFVRYLRIRINLCMISSCSLDVLFDTKTPLQAPSQQDQSKLFQMKAKAETEFEF